MIFFLANFIAPNVRAEEILDFTQKIIINKDGSLEVSEIIIYNFGDEGKNEFFRDIPYKYKVKEKNYHLQIKNISVVNSQGEKYNFKILKQDDNQRIKIWGKDLIFSGRQIYQINYTVKKAFGFFDNYDELYWNVTGYDFGAKIRQSKSTVVLPDKVNEEDINIECFSGIYGSTDNCVSKRYVYEAANKVKEIVFIDDVLQTRKGFAIVVSLPKNIVLQPSFFEKSLDIMSNIYIFGFFLLIFIFFYYLWIKVGHR